MHDACMGKISPQVDEDVQGERRNAALLLSPLSVQEDIDADSTEDNRTAGCGGAECDRTECDAAEPAAKSVQVSGIKRRRKKKFICKGCGTSYDRQSLLTSHEMKCLKVVSSSDAASDDWLNGMEQRHIKVCKPPCMHRRMHMHAPTHTCRCLRAAPCVQIQSDIDVGKKELEKREMELEHEKQQLADKKFKSLAPEKQGFARGRKDLTGQPVTAPNAGSMHDLGQRSLAQHFPDYAAEQSRAAGLTGMVQSVQGKADALLARGRKHGSSLHVSRCEQGVHSSSPLLSGAGSPADDSMDLAQADASPSRWQQDSPDHYRRSLCGMQQSRSRSRSRSRHRSRSRSRSRRQSRSR